MKFDECELALVQMTTCENTHLGLIPRKYAHCPIKLLTPHNGRGHFNMI